MMEKVYSSLSKIRIPARIEVINGQTVIIMLRNVIEKEYDT